MTTKLVQNGDDLLTMYRVLFFDLPLASAWGNQVGLQEREIVERAWKGYDAWARLGTGMIDNLYRTPLFDEAVARSLDALLRWQRLTNAFTGAAFAWARSTIDLPPTAIVHELCAAIEALREDVQKIRENYPALSKQSTAFFPLEASQMEVNPQAWKEALRALRRAHSGASPAQQMSAHTAALPFNSAGSHTGLTRDVSDCFEPVNVNEDAQTVSEPATWGADLSSYFEPVTYRATAPAQPVETSPKRRRQSETTARSSLASGQSHDPVAPSAVITVPTSRAARQKLAVHRRLT